MTKHVAIPIVECTAVLQTFDYWNVGKSIMKNLIFDIEDPVQEHIFHGDVFQTMNF